MKNLPNKKKLYLLTLLIIILINLIIKPTYAKFSKNYITQNDVAELIIDFNIGIKNIEEYEEVKVPAGSYKLFNVKIANTTTTDENNTGTLYYGIWYKMVNPTNITSDITVARLDGTQTLTSGEITSQDIATTTILIINDSINEITINIGVASSNTSNNDIEYLDGKKLITGTAKKKEGIYITDVDYQNNINANLETSKINDVYQTSLNSTIALSPTDPDSSITYTITVYNHTDETYYFQGIFEEEIDSSYSNPNIVYTLENLKTDSPLRNKESITFNITFQYKDNLISDNNILYSQLNFIFKKKHKIVYNNLKINENLPTEIYDGETLIIDLNTSPLTNINVYSNGVLKNDYIFENKILTIENISSNLTIQGVYDNNYDITITDKDTSFFIIDSNNEEPIKITDLIDKQFSVINSSNKKITKIELLIVYTSTTGSKQITNSTLTHNNIEHNKSITFNGKSTNVTLTTTFDNLSIEPYDVFTIVNLNGKITNGNVTISSEELKFYFEE